MNFSTGSTPSSRSAPCAASPGTVSRKLSAPACAGAITNCVGSTTIAPSPVWPRSIVASMPAPPSSSPITLWIWSDPVQIHARIAQRPRGLQRAAQASLHVHDAATEQAPGMARQLERRAGPAFGFSRGDDIDVTVQDERAALTAALGAALGVTHDPDHAEPFMPLHVRRVGGMTAQPLEVDLPHVGLETDVPHLHGHPLLGRSLAVRDALDRDQVAEKPEQAL